jgi:threonine/homoserine/homoserine lactone efflux protein
MTINCALLLAYVASIVLLIVTPGPVVMLVVGTTARRGVRQGVLTAMGANAASLVLIAVATLMVFGVVLISERLLAWLQVLGCIFVAVLASRALYGEWRANGVSSDKGMHVATSQPQRFPALLQGFFVGIANPKDILFFVAFFPQFIGVTSDSRASLAMLATLWMVVDFTLLGCYITAFRHPLVHRLQRRISTLSSGLLLVIAIAGLAGAGLGGSI